MRLARYFSPETIELLRAGMQIASLAAFMIFVVLGVAVIRADPATRRRAINHLLLYTLAVHAAIAILQTDAWPFSMYPMMAKVETSRAELHSMLAATAVDSAGREWAVDPATWSPLYPPSALVWFNDGFPRASTAEREQVMSFLLQRAETSRRQQRDRKTWRGNRMILGPVAAPDSNLYGGEAPSPLPYQTLRIYRVFWNPTRWLRDPGSAQRTLICEYRR